MRCGASHGDRFRRGDRTAFSRRLYTAQGQKTFEDVRQRYAEDNDFRLTVDRYLQEFERLLETYLAHAPGGFPSFAKAIPAWMRIKLHISRLLRADHCRERSRAGGAGAAFRAR